MSVIKNTLLLIFAITGTTSREDKKVRAKLANVASSNFFHDVACYWQESPDDLPYGDDIAFPRNSIFFIETTCRGCIELRQACSIESAARTHPKRAIVVFFTGPVPESCLFTEAAQAVLKYKNVKLYRIHMAQFAENTPLEPWFKGQYWRNSMKTSCFPVHHTSDVLRFVTLYKFGGIYLDLDVIVVRPFDWLKHRNWAGKQKDSEIGTALLALANDSFGRAIIHSTVRVLDESYEPKNYNFNSISILTKALQLYCSTPNVTKWNLLSCPGFRIYPKKYFYPISHSSWEYFFKPGPLDIGEAYAFHVWNKLSQDEIIVKGSPYARLAKRFCPSIFKIYNKDYTLSRKPKIVVKQKPVENEDYIIE